MLLTPSYTEVSQHYIVLRRTPQVDLGGDDTPKCVSSISKLTPPLSLLRATRLLYARLFTVFMYVNNLFKKYAHANLNCEKLWVDYVWTVRTRLARIPSVSAMF
jgi:hypothetical protein